jgi:beta-glucanase (GH16 family)
MLQKRVPHISLCILIAIVALVMTAGPILNVSAAPAQQTGWSQVWADEFSGSGAPSSTNWNYHVGNGFNPGAGGFDGWGNGEWEWYRPGNCYQEGGSLVIRADYNTAPTNIAGRDWYQFSCRITSDTKRSMTYGAIEARIRMPNNIGTWPAFWMMGDACDDTSTGNYTAPMSYYDTMASNWSSCGEVDIMEHRNTDASVVHNLFWDSRVGVFPWDCCTNQNNPSTIAVSDVAVFHTYRLEWTSTQLRWLIDGTVTKTQDISASNMEEFRKPFHIILNLAISGAFTGNAQPNQAEFPLYMYVDYVRVYQAGTGPTPTPTPTTPGGGLPSPWQTQDIGAVAAAGAASHSSGTFTVDGSGADIWGSADEFRYVYQTLNGNGQITARVASQQNTNGWAKAGVMIRESLSAGSKHAMMVLTPGNGLAFQRRTSTGGASDNTAGGAASAPRWVRLVRSGSTFTAYASTNGTSWTTVGSATISMSSSVTVGLAVTSHADGTLSRVTFDNVSVQTGGSPTPTPSPTSTALFTQGVENVTSSSARVWFRPNGWTAGYVIVHYLYPGIVQQNVQMTYNSGATRWELTFTGISAGQRLDYQFTYQKDGVQSDSAWFSWVKP